MSEKPQGSGESTLTVVLALLVNLAIAVMKAIAGVLTGSAAILSEAAHSVADTFTEALLLTMLFCSSRNVINHATSIWWSQTASAFLLPPILLIAWVAARMTEGRGRRVLAAFAGLLGALLYTQEFYTAHFALFFVSAAIATWLIVEKHRAISAIRSSSSPTTPRAGPG